MEARLLLLADYASVDAAGKLNIIGAFNRINAAAFPAVHQLMYLVVKLAAELGEFDQQRSLRVALFDEDGLELWQIDNIPFQVHRPDRATSGEIHHLIAIQFMRFERPGRYEFRVFVNGDYKGSVPLDVVPLESPKG